jgi:hypothetical protein
MFDVERSMLDVHLFLIALSYPFLPLPSNVFKLTDLDRPFRKFGDDFQIAAHGWIKFLNGYWVGSSGQTISHKTYLTLIFLVLKYKYGYRYPLHTAQNHNPFERASRPPRNFHADFRTG